MDLERILAAARRHGEEADPEHETGDLIDVLRAAWPSIPEARRRTLAREEPIARLLRDWGAR